MIGKISPITGAMITADNAGYIYSGFEINYDLGPLKLTPSFAPVFYSQGDGKDLGHPLEFKSEVQLSLDLGDTTNFGMSYNHVSNASLGDKNPGQIATGLIFLKVLIIFNDMGLKDCHNFNDFRKLAKKAVSPIFHYIDGAADDEVTYKRNTDAFNDVDLVPNVLRGVENVDLSTTIFGKKLDLPFYCSPTALQRLFHYQGERAVGKAAQKFNTMFGVSSLATVSVEEISSMIDTPKLFQFYYHKDKGLNNAILERVKAAKFDVMALTVDTITGGNRERDLRTGFTSPPKLTLASLFSFIQNLCGE